MDAEDSARMRDLMANSRTLLAWIRTAISFAGLGFVVAKFGVYTGLHRTSDAIGIVMALIGLVFTVLGYVQYLKTLELEQGPPDSPVPLHWPTATATACCAVSCLVLAVYLALS
jgi:putative membrane protein